MNATATRIPTITATSTPNFYDVLSSDNKTHYPMIVEGPGMVCCGCMAGTTLYDEKGNIVKQAKNCYHRQWAIANLIYIDPEISMRLTRLELELKELNNQIWAAIQAAASDEDDRYAAEELWAA